MRSGQEPGLGKPCLSLTTGPLWLANRARHRGLALPGSPKRDGGALAGCAARQGPALGLRFRPPARGTKARRRKRGERLHLTKLTYLPASRQSRHRGPDAPCCRESCVEQPMTLACLGNACRASGHGRCGCLSGRRRTTEGVRVRPNVRAERTTEARRPWAAQENGACEWPARPKGAVPRRVRSRARG
jgi:hypothetical protein